MTIILKSDHIVLDNKVRWWSNPQLPIATVPEIQVHTLNYADTWKALHQAKRVADYLVVTTTWNRNDVQQACYDFCDKYRLQFAIAGHLRIDNSGREHAFSHGGDVGDTLAGLLTLRNVGGGTLYLRPGGAVRCPYTTAKVDSLRPLLEQQSYIKRVELGDSDDAVALDAWRCAPLTLDLATGHLRYFGAPEDYSPWLTASPRQVSEIVIARSPRYRSWSYRYWLDVLDHYRKFSKVFVGFRDEHLDFCERFGPIDWCETPDYGALCSVIAGAKLCIMNQSSPCWCAIGLGKRVLQESCKQCLNCVVPGCDIVAKWQDGGALPQIS